MNSSRSSVRWNYMDARVVECRPLSWEVVIRFVWIPWYCRLMGRAVAMYVIWRAL